MIFRIIEGFDIERIKERFHVQVQTRFAFAAD